MAEEKALDLRERGEALKDDGGGGGNGGGSKAGPSSTSTPPQPPKPLTINDLPKEMLVSIFMAIEDLRWVRHTIPLVCKAWNEIYLSKDASPLHETLEVDFYEEVKRALEEEEELLRVLEGARFGRLPRRIVLGPSRSETLSLLPPVQASRVISWAERRAGSVHKLYLDGGFRGALEDFSSKDLGALLAVTGPSLTDIFVGRRVIELPEKPFWEAVRESVVPAGRLRSFVVHGMFADALEYCETFGQLAGSLEELVLDSVLAINPQVFRGDDLRLARFPEAFCALTELRVLILVGHFDITALPANISSLKKLERLQLICGLSSVPKELGELSGLTMLELYLKVDGDDAPPADEVQFPAELGKLKSLRRLSLNGCFRSVPARVSKFKSLESLRLAFHADAQIGAPLDFLIEGCPRLREVELRKRTDEGPWTPESLALLEGFKTKLLAKNPSAEVTFMDE